MRGDARLLSSDFVRYVELLETEEANDERDRVEPTLAPLGERIGIFEALRRGELCLVLGDIVASADCTVSRCSFVLVAELLEVEATDEPLPL